MPDAAAPSGRSASPTPAAPGVPPFAVRDCALASMATGKRAFDLRELRDNLVTIHPDSIYHHFWGAMLRPRFENPEYLNDFAEWAYHGLRDKTLAERLGVIDPAESGDLEALRRELLEIVEERIDSSQPGPWYGTDRPFHFLRSQIVVFDTRRRVAGPRELGDLIPKMSVSSVFYHFIDARRRLPTSVDDFRAWLGLFGTEHGALIERLGQVDPYFATLQGLRGELAQVFAAYFAEGGG